MKRSRPRPQTSRAQHKLQEQRRHLWAQQQELQERERDAPDENDWSGAASLECRVGGGAAATTAL
ncbi:hypothetical protein PR002_g19362 [Phytophthora rubi]|nr:hypothetical protein PR002_g19362 [Phytophthora rubi]